MPFKQHSCRSMMFSSLIKTTCVILMITFPKSSTAHRYYFLSKIILEKYYQDINRRDSETLHLSYYDLNACGKENVTFSFVCSFLLLSLYTYPPLCAFYYTNVRITQQSALYMVAKEGHLKFGNTRYPNKTVLTKPTL